jgi:hypothetical protein
VTDGASLFEVGRKALAWFNDPFWKGTKPTDDTIFEIALVGSPERKYYVRVASLKAEAPSESNQVS